MTDHLSLSIFQRNTMKYLKTMKSTYLFILFFCLSFALSAQHPALNLHKNPGFVTVEFESKLTEGYAMSVWINPSAYPAEGKKAFIMGKHDNLYVYLNSRGELEFYSPDSSAVSLIKYQGNSLPLNSWTEITLNANKAVVDIYGNGKKMYVLAQKTSSSLKTNQHHFGFAGLNKGEAATLKTDFQKFDGFMAYPAVWNHKRNTPNFEKNWGEKPHPLDEHLGVFLDLSYQDSCNGFCNKAAHALEGTSVKWIGKEEMPLIEEKEDLVLQESAPVLMLFSTEDEEDDAPTIGMEEVVDGEIDETGDEKDAIVEMEPDVNDVIVAEKQPVPINMMEVRKRIGYPKAARRKGGTVVARVLVDEKGNYVRHVIINVGHPILSEAVEEHISLLKFSPAIQGGKPIKLWTNIPFGFKPLR
jgi:hypothetical protein